jgi:WS/DGAT/MGAT family acyltransferase
MNAPSHQRMSSIDTAWLRMDGPGSPMMIVGVSATETPIRPADFRRMLETRLLCFERFRQRPVTDAMGASWVEHESFDLDEHLVVDDLEAPAGKRQLQAVAARLASEPLDPGRPLWQFHLFPRYGAGSAWITRVHHCYGDGIAMTRVLLSMTEQDAPPVSAARRTGRGPGRRGGRPGFGTPAIPEWLNRLTQPTSDILEQALAGGAKLLEAGIHQAFHLETTAGVLAQAGSMIGEFAKVLVLPDEPATPLRGALGGRKAIAWADPIPLADMKTIGHALDCTLNDVVMATVAGALGSHLRERGFDTDGLVLRASTPVNLRGVDEPLTLGNKFGLVFVDLPVGTRNPLQRVYSMHGTMQGIKRSVQPPMTLLALGLMGFLPAGLQAPAIDLLSRKASVVVSNVPGPQAPLYMCGQRISDMHFWVPQSGTIGVGISVLTYAGRVHFGVIADRNLVDDPAALAERFGPEFEQLLLAATVGALAARQARAPARPRRPAGTRKPTKSRKPARRPAGTT